MTTSKFKIGLAGGVALIFLPLLSSVRAQVLNVQFTDNAVGNSLAGTAYSSSVAALAYSGSTWTVGFTTSASDLPDSENNSTTVGFTLDGSPFTTNNGGSPLKLVQESYGSGSGLTLTLNGLNPAKSYDLFLYDGFNANPTNFEVNGVTMNAAGSNAGTFTSGANYVEFANVTPTDDSIVVTLTNGSTGFSLIQGFQLEAVVPEPSTWAMMFVGAGALVWFARRRLA